MSRRFLVCAVIAAVALSLVPMRSGAADKTILELQRDVAGLADQVRLLKESQDKQLAALTELVRQALETSSKSNTGVAVIQSNLQQSLRDMEGKVVAPVAGLSTRLDGVDQDLRALQQSVADLNNLMGKLQGQLTDLNNAVKILQTPAPAPPTAATATPASAAPDVPTISATDLYANANRDRGSGKYDIAVQEYQDYLKYYGNTELAPAAQFYIGYIHLYQKNNAEAVKDFDTVLEKYPDDSNRVPQAFFYKGMALQNLGRLTDASKEYRELIDRYPKIDLATKACDQLVAMGLHCPAPKAAPAKTPPKKKKQ